ncbi:MAG: pectate lyase, partial [Cellvibrionaceae bacterium]
MFFNEKNVSKVHARWLIFCLVVGLVFFAFYQPFDLESPSSGLEPLSTDLEPPSPDLEPPPSNSGQQFDTDLETGSLLSHMNGFAKLANTTGGEGQLVYTVTSAANEGDGTLRHALTAGNRYIVFDQALDGREIFLNEDIVTEENNITIDGRNIDITITGGAIKFEGDNYVLGFLSFKDNLNLPTTDAITFRNAPENGQRFFIFKCSFNHASDGLIDVIWNQGHKVFGTIKLSTFSSHNKTILIDSNSSRKEGGRYYVTLDQNYFLKTTQRLPLARRGFVHFYNNLLEKWGDAQGHGGGSYAGTDSQYLIENNIAIAYVIGDEHHEGGVVAQPLTKVFAPHYEELGDVRASGNLFVNGAYGVEKNAIEVFNPPYEYTLFDARSSLEA